MDKIGNFLEVGDKVAVPWCNSYTFHPYLVIVEITEFRGVGLVGRNAEDKEDQGEYHIANCNIVVKVKEDV